MLRDHYNYFDPNGWEEEGITEFMGELELVHINSMWCNNPLCNYRWEHIQLYKECPICGDSYSVAEYRAYIAKELNNG